MKKIFATLMASMLLLSSTTYATEKFSVLNKVDSKMLFGKSNVNTLALDQNEMKETEGEFWGWILAAVAAFLLSGDERSQQSQQSQYDRANKQFKYGYSRLTPAERNILHLGMTGQYPELFNRAQMIGVKAVSLGANAGIK